MKLYAARNKDGKLFIFIGKPIKDMREWVTIEYGMMQVEEKLFPSVQWEDKEPTEVTLGIINQPSEEPDKFDPSDLNPFDKVLARDRNDDRWLPTHFGFFNYKVEGKRVGFECVNGAFFRYCIPYNEETKHLLGTKQEEPPKYKWWK